MRPSVPDVHITDARDGELAEYHPVAWQAVLGLLFGLFAALAMVDPLLWSIPILGILVNVAALRRIRAAAPAVAGRKMALAGFLLSLLFLSAAVGDWWVYRRMVAQEAQQFTALWFRYVTQEQPEKACQLTMAPQARRPLDDQLWAYYRNNPQAREQLESYVKIPLVRTLLALGPKARVRFHGTAGQSRDNLNDQVEQIYVVTYEEDNEKISFFVLVRALRAKQREGGAQWRILQTEGGFRPDGW
jgi:hypothetical protein